jgi:mannitol/fructose-specific phosphotransferase system IIA component (Ntr-type)
MRILLEALQAGRLFELTETSKKGAFEFLGRVLEAIPEIPDDSGVVEAMHAREAAGNTAIAPGVACPHARVEGITADIHCALGWSKDGIDYEAGDGKRVHLVIAYWIPDCQRVGFLKEMSGLAKAIMTSGGVESFRDCGTLGEVRHRLLDWVTLVLSHDSGPDARARMLRLSEKINERADGAPPAGA